MNSIKPIGIIVSIIIFGFSQDSSAQSKASKFAIIEFVGEKTDNSKTFIGKLKKGDPYRLSDALQSGTNDQTIQEEPDFSPKEYQPKKDRNETKYLNEIYNINEKKLKKNKGNYRRKYFEEKERVYNERGEVKKQKPKRTFNIKSLFQGKKTETRLAKNFKIKTKRLRKGKKLKYPGGNINLLIKYEIRTGNQRKTYLTDLETSVQAGSKYYLKYYGNEGKRKYFLERIP
ncbi:MAG: hypothetical protein PF487_06180 [Bacteroidales bacterium]|jgi:hypothetical protein|nr:hypothetical protein [Bacteroidales bacterium]